ncbi:hypothetical protein IAT40_004990 [Kwoniella sp. CBS 6097]
MGSGSDLGNTILLLNHPSVDSLDFLTRLTGVNQARDDAAIWTIDNKYYNAEVVFDVLPLGRNIDESIISRYREQDVILYLFDKVPTALPSTLVKLLSTPRDIALAIRVLPPTSQEATPRLDANGHGDADRGSTSGAEERDEVSYAVFDGDGDGNATDLFEEIGMEFVDEVHPLTEEDDERPLEPLETVRQTLMTHLWPNMVRKSIGRGPNPSSFPAVDRFSPISSPTDSPSTSQFPITFSRDMNGASASMSSAFNFADRSVNGSGELADETVTFPALHELRAAIRAEDFEAIDRLDRMDERFGIADAFGPGQEEYARLDDWLDEDDEEYEPAFTSGGVDDAQSTAQDGKVGIEQKRTGDYPDHGERASENGGSVRAGTNRTPSGDKGDWLDSDDIKFDPVASDLPSGFVNSTATTSTNDSETSSVAEENQHNAENVNNNNRSQAHQQEAVEGFEDDFEFTDFHSAPAAALHGISSSGRGLGLGSNSNRNQDGATGTLALDPTPLLLHLQNVREELAGIGNEDERRVRAGKEVAQLMASLGMDMDMDMGMDLEMGSDGLEFDDDDDLARIP